MSVSDATAAEPAAGTAEQGGERAAPDFAPLIERLDQGLGDIRSQLAELQTGGQAQVEPAEQVDPWAQEFADLFGEDPAAQEPQGLDAQRLVQGLQQATQQQLQQALAPVLEQMGGLQGALAAQDLEARYPELKDPEFVQEKLGPAAQEWAQKIGDPSLARHPALVELAYLASKVDKAAQSEVPAGGDHVGLESAAGGAGQAVSEVDEAKRIVQAGGGSRQWV